jgi:hypothetical protein
MKTTALTATAVTALNPTDIDLPDDNKLGCYKPGEHNSLCLQDCTSDLKMKRGQVETFQPCFAISVSPFGEI